MKPENISVVSDSHNTKARRFYFSAAIFVVLSLACVLPASARNRKAQAAAPVFVNTALGGFILGYDIDQNGNEGILAEALTLSDGSHNVALETFDQTTGQITKIIAQQNMSKNDYVALGVYGNAVGLIEFEKVTGIFVSQRLYRTMNPLSGNVINGRWTPPLTLQQQIIGIAPNQATSNTVVLAAQGFGSFLFGTDLTANTFGQKITLPGSTFGFTSVLGFDPTRNLAVVANSLGGVQSSPDIAFVDPTTGTINQIKGLGFGSVNGIATDSVKGRAVTTTEIDFSIEYYDLDAQASILVEPLHNATNQSQRGGAVAFDPINRIFLVGQEFSSLAPTGSSIHVYDERGTFLKGINGLSLPASPAYMALNPSKRMGYVIVTPALNQLQQFTY